MIELFLTYIPPCRHCRISSRKHLPPRSLKTCEGLLCSLIREQNYFRGASLLAGPYIQDEHIWLVLQTSRESFFRHGNLQLFGLPTPLVPTQVGCTRDETHKDQK